MHAHHGSSQTKRAATELRRRIVNGELPGGARMLEVAVAEDLQISRTPAREAMSRLAEEGLLERARGGGFQVRAFTLRDALDAVDLRGVLEGVAVRRAAEGALSKADLAPIAALLARIDAAVESAAAPDFDAYSELNHQFHELIAALSGSGVLLRELDRVKSLPFASPSAFVFGPAEPWRALQSLLVAQSQHRALLEAIERGEGARAEAIAREHATIARRNLELAAAGLADGRSPLPGMALIVEGSV